MSAQQRQRHCDMSALAAMYLELLHILRGCGAIEQLQCFENAIQGRARTLLALWQVGKSCI